MSFIVILVGIGRGFDAAKETQGYTQILITFIGAFVWWFLVAVLLFESGKAITAYLQRGKAPRHTFIVAGSFIAIGLLVLGLTQIVQGLISPTSQPFVLPLFFLTIGLAVLLMIGSAFTYREREERPVEDGWRH